MKDIFVNLNPNFGQDPLYMDPVVMSYMRDAYNISIPKSKIYNKPLDIEYFGYGNKFTYTTVEDIDTVGCIYKYTDQNKQNEKVVVLNFASFVNPGGGCTHGAIAQEEALCYESSLYYVLKTFQNYYINNGKDTNRDLYYDRCIYTPNVAFGRIIEGTNIIDKRFCDVITCAAPFTKAAISHGVTVEECRNAMSSRIKFILDIAQDNNADTLILGAFGCGVFGNDPKSTAEIFKSYLDNSRYDFNKVIFAIPKSINYDIFNTVIS